MKTWGKKYFEYFGCLVSENRFCLTIIYLFKVAVETQYIESVQS